MICIFIYGIDILMYEGKREYAFYKGSRMVDGLM